MPKVIVTGASGFVGSHVADTLSDKNYEVVLFDIVESKYKKTNQIFIKGNLLDKNLLDEILYGVDFVYHFGGIADIDYSDKFPYDTLNTNIMGTVNLIESSLKNKIKRFMFASSVYVHSDKGGFYSASKKACEDIIENYSKTRGLNYTILRYGTLYGSRSNIKNGCYRIIKNILENQTYSYDGTGKEMREFINVLDAAKISVECLDEKYKNECLILTGAEKMRMDDLIEMIKEITKRRVKVEYLRNNNPLHYNITPYNYTPKLGKKIISNPYIDIGQGLIELIKEVIKQENIYEYDMPITLNK